MQISNWSSKLSFKSMDNFNFRGCLMVRTGTVSSIGRRKMYRLDPVSYLVSYGTYWYEYSTTVRNTAG